MDKAQFVGLFFIIVDVFILNCEAKGEIMRSACYGTYNNFLDLECPWREKIKIHKVYQGAKPTSLECPYPTDQNSYKEECCVPAEDDCMFQIDTAEPNSYEALCNNRSTCKLLTMWSGTTGFCDPNKFNSHTNFMKITYSCVPGIKKTTTTEATTTTTRKTSPKTYVTPQIMTERPKSRILESSSKATITSTTTTTTRSSTQPETSTLINAPGSATKSTPTTTIQGYVIPSKTPPVPSTKANVQEDNSFAFTTGMMGGMVAAIIGLMLTIFGFIFYWGRKRRHMIMTKPQTSVWDFLLSQNINFRPFKRGGYDNFNSHRSSISSDGEANSPVARKAGWTPNIAIETASVTEPTTSDDNCSIVDVHRSGHV